ERDRGWGPGSGVAGALRCHVVRATYRARVDLRRLRTLRARGASYDVGVPRAEGADPRLMVARSNHRFLIIADGQFEPMTSKTANCCIRYMPERVVGVFDRGHAGKTV